MTVTDEVDKLIREKVEPAARVIRQNELDLYDDEEKNTAMSPIESTDAELARLKREIDESVRRPPERQLSFWAALHMVERIALLERRRQQEEKVT